MCDTTMKHMCTGAWTPFGGGPKTTRCSRCEFKFCDYHIEVNTGGAQGGHNCVCSEGAKNVAYGNLCSRGSFKKCPHCGQNCCDYHAPSNQGGQQGGHSGCPGPKCATTWGSCGGFVEHQCEYCEEWYCRNHKDYGGRVSGGKHACNIGCQTSYHTMGNCTGTKRQVMKCKWCMKVGNDYGYCPYHIMPVSSLLSITAEQGGGGHVCQGFTGGSMLLGDSLVSYFDLACQLGTTVASGGTANPLSATLAANACVVACYELLDHLGFEKMFELSKTIGKLVKAIKQYTESKDDDGESKDKIQIEKELIDTLRAAHTVLGHLPGLGTQIKSLQEAIEKGQTTIEGALGILEKILAIWGTANNLKAALPELNKVAKQKPVPNPMDVVNAVKKCAAVADTLQTALK